MIMEIPQPITCFISTKSEILSDYAAPRAAGAAPSPRTALTARGSADARRAISGGRRGEA
jgi:hypothetical protein